MTRRSDGTIVGVKGRRLAYRTWEAANARAALVVVHGLGEHSGRYAEFGERMAGYGVSTFAMDLRGHGLSEGRRGHVASFDIFLQELDRFRREVEGLADFRIPLFLLGHSFGGLIALRYQEEYNTRFEGAILSAPWLATAPTVRRWKANAAQFLSKLLPSMPFRAGIRSEDLTHDADVVASRDADPLVHDRITPRLFSETSTAMGLALQRSDRIHEPLLFLLAGDDRLVDTERSLTVARAIPAPDVTVRVFPGYFHEVLNEVGRTTIHREIRDWIAARA
jgi:alpha-beta hydrolase superfamily lysophospholipase